MRAGLLHLFIRHTSASLTLNENASPDVRDDFESYFDAAVPRGRALLDAHGRGSRRHARPHQGVAARPVALAAGRGRPARARHLAGRSTCASTATAAAPAACSRRCTARATSGRARPAGASRRTPSRPRGRPRRRRSGRRSRPGAPTPPPPSSRRRRRGSASSPRARAGRWRRSPAASSRAAASAPPGSASRLTIPIACARSARDRVAGERELHRQVVRDPLRAAGSARRAAATSPRLTSGMPTFASRAATIRSHASATSNPPATA